MLAYDQAKRHHLVERLVPRLPPTGEQNALGTTHSTAERLNRSGRLVMPLDLARAGRLEGFHEADDAGNLVRRQSRSECRPEFGFLDGAAADHLGHQDLAKD